MHQVDRTERINGITLEEAAEKAYFSLVPSLDGAKVVVEMPVIVFAVLNKLSSFRICDPILLNPFNEHWSGVELVSLASLQANIRNLQQKKKTYATYVLFNI